MKRGYLERGLTVGLMAIFLLVVLGAGPKERDKPIKIAHLNGLSGSNAEVGASSVEGVKYAVKRWNAKGGLLGHPIEVVIRDDQMKPDLAITQARDLHESQGIDFITGVTSSGVAMALTKWCKENKVLFVNTCAGSRGMTDKEWQPYYFHTTPTTVERARSLAPLVAQKGYTKYFLFGPDYEWGHRMCEDFMKMIKKVVPEAKVVGEVWAKLGEADMTPYISKIAASDAQVIVSAHYGADICSFFRQAQPYNLWKRMVYANNLIADSGSTRPAGWIIPEGQFGSIWYAPYYRSTKNDKYVAAYKEWCGHEPDLRSYEADMLGLEFLFQAITKAGSFNLEKVIKAGEGLKWETPMGTCEMRAFDHQAIVPFISGISCHDPKYPGYVTMCNMKLQPGEQVMRSINELLADGHPGRPDLRK